MLKATWTGNLRDLVKLCEYLVGNVEDEVGLEDLPPAFREGLGLGVAAPVESLPVVIRRTLDACGGNKSEAARRLGKSRGHLHRILKQTAGDGTSGHSLVSGPPGGAIEEPRMG